MPVVTIQAIVKAKGFVQVLDSFCSLFKSLIWYAKHTFTGLTMVVCLFF